MCYPRQITKGAASNARIPPVWPPWCDCVTQRRFPSAIKLSTSVQVTSNTSTPAISMSPVLQRTKSLYVSLYYCWTCFPARLSCIFPNFEYLVTCVPHFLKHAYQTFTTITEFWTCLVLIHLCTHVCRTTLECPNLIPNLVSRYLIVDTIAPSLHSTL